MKNNQQIYSAEFLLEIINHLPDALVVIDREMRIKISNRLFQEIFNSGNAIELDEVLGKTISCKDFNNDESSHLKQINCSLCKLLTSIKKTLSTKKTQKQESIVLQIVQNNKADLRLIQFQSTYLNFNNEEFVLLKLNDLTEFGKETVNLITDLGKMT